MHDELSEDTDQKPLEELEKLFKVIIGSLCTGAAIGGLLMLVFTFIGCGYYPIDSPGFYATPLPPNARFSGATVSWAERKKMSPVTVSRIDNVTGYGYIWVESVSDAAGAPTWSIDKPNLATIMPYTPKPNRAYIGGNEGVYTVTATYPDGSAGSLVVEIKHE